jgi:SAM-dependent methyltransferase
MRFIVVLSLLLLVTTTSANQQNFDPSIKKTIDEIYSGLNAFKATNEDRNEVSKAGGAPIYGEILPSSVHLLARYFKIKENDVFYDLGSGNGKVAMQIYLYTPAKKSVGVELSLQRHQQALEARKRCLSKKLAKSDKTLDYVQGDILKADISDATLIYMCSTCYTPRMMKILQSKVENLPKGVKVATLKKFKKSSKLKLVESLSLPMTWSKSSPVYIYQVT